MALALPCCFFRFSHQCGHELWLWTGCVCVAFLWFLIHIQVFFPNIDHSLPPWSIQSVHQCKLCAVRVLIEIEVWSLAQVRLYVLSRNTFRHCLNNKLYLNKVLLLYIYPTLMSYTFFFFIFMGQSLNTTTSCQVNISGQVRTLVEMIYIN